MLPFSDIPGPELIDIGTDEPGQGLVVIKEHEVPRSQQEVKPVRSVFHHFIGYILHAQELDHQEVYQHHHAVEQDILHSQFQRSQTDLLDQPLEDRIVSEEEDKDQRRFLVRSDEQAEQ